ncbi:hypothetical protein COT72_05120 [archaeon CG10_big_fil_rev_8_21_14_0_10_43_11]|nr:MAG: hypothetical protein COT72_05120 [archaeon CG10_big_fil_rev_8_21_14_0_10_43_11]
MKQALMLLLVGIVALSGCSALSGGDTQTPVVRGKYGLAIASYAAENTILEPGQSTALRLHVRNVGNQSATNVVMQLINTGLLDVEGDTTTKPANIETFPTIEHGDNEEITWIVRAPQTAGVDYRPLVKMCYDMTSVGYVTVKAVDNAVYNQFTVELATLSDSTDGPVSITFQVDNPIVINDGGEIEQITINLNNVDEGQISTAQGTESFGELNSLDAGSFNITFSALTSRIEGSTATCAKGSRTGDGRCDLGKAVRACNQAGCVYDSSQDVCTPSEEGDWTCSTRKYCLYGEYSPSTDQCYVKEGYTFDGQIDSYWQCSVNEQTNQIDCTNTDRIRFINGERARMRINIPLMAPENEVFFEDVVTFEAQAKYKYCINTDPLRIQVRNR